MERGLHLSRCRGPRCRVYPRRFPGALLPRLDAGEDPRPGRFCQHTDYGIVVEHVSPGDLGSFWRNQVWRSGMWAPSVHFFGGRSLAAILVRELLKNLWRWLLMLLVVPFLYHAFVDSMRLGGARYFGGMLLTRYVQAAAFTVGSLKGVFRVARYLRERDRV